jgi:hypothetical protein
MAQSLGLSLQRARQLISRARGAPARKRIPARNPPGVPQPKPAMPIHPGRIRNQGDRATQKLILPILSDFILLYSLAKNRVCTLYARPLYAYKSLPFDIRCSIFDIGYSRVGFFAPSW